jgi:hypothetical protein
MGDNLITGQRQQLYLPFRGVDNDSSLYLPLDPTSQDIRYLRLHAGSDNDPIVCSLDHTTLDQKAGGCVPYIALSYCWGEVNDTTEIDVRFPNPDEGFATQRFRITRNLYAALYALRFPQDDRVLWIDAICISQSDPKEKTHQVGLLSLIFSSAAEVVVWLGKEDTSSRIVMRCQEHLWTCISKRNLHPSLHMLERTELDQIWWEFMQQLFEDSELRKEMAVSWLQKYSDVYYRKFVSWDRRYKSICTALYSSLDQLLARSWFRRIWVFQGVLLSPRDLKGNLTITLLAGSSTMSWQAWAALTRLCFKSPCVQSYERENLTWFNGAWFKSTMMAGLARYAYYFDRTRKFLSSDPRDKLFALLHIATDTQKRIEYDPMLRPNYEKSLDVIVLEFAICGVVVPMLLRTLPALEGKIEENQPSLKSGSHFWFELLYPSDFYADFEFYDKDPSPFAQVQILPYEGEVITTIAQRLDLKLGRSWCKENGIFELAFADRIAKVLRAFLLAVEPLVRETYGFALFKNVLIMIGIPEHKVQLHWVGFGRMDFSDLITEWPDVDVWRFSQEVYDIDQTWFWALACTGSWTPHNGYGAPQLFITADNRLVLGSNEVQVGDFVVQMPGSNTPFMMAADRWQHNPRISDYRFEGVCSFYPGTLL